MRVRIQAYAHGKVLAPKREEKPNASAVAPAVPNTATEKGQMSMQPAQKEQSGGEAATGPSGYSNDYSAPGPGYQEPSYGDQYSGYAYPFIYPYGGIYGGWGYGGYGYGYGYGGYGGYGRYGGGGGYGGRGYGRNGRSGRDGSSGNGRNNENPRNVPRPPTRPTKPLGGQRGREHQRGWPSGPVKQRIPPTRSHMYGNMLRHDNQRFNNMLRNRQMPRQMPHQMQRQMPQMHAQMPQMHGVFNHPQFAAPHPNGGFRGGGGGGGFRGGAGGGRHR